MIRGRCHCSAQDSSLSLLLHVVPALCLACCLIWAGCSLCSIPAERCLHERPLLLLLAQQQSVRGNDHFKVSLPQLQVWVETATTSSCNHPACWGLQVWRSTLWSDIKTEIMEEGTKNFVKEVKSLNKKVRDDDCFKVRHQVGLLAACLTRPV